MQVAIVAARPVEDAEEQPAGVQAGQEDAQEQAEPEDRRDEVVRLGRFEDGVLAERPETSAAGRSAPASRPETPTYAARQSALRSPPMSGKLLAAVQPWITTPAVRKSSALNEACVTRWNIAANGEPRPSAANM